MVLCSLSEGSLGWIFNMERLFPFLGGTAPVRSPGVSASGAVTHREHIRDKKLSGRRRLREIAIAGGTGRAVGQLPQRGALVLHTLAQSKLRVLHGVSVLCLCWQRQQAVSLDSLLKNRGSGRNTQHRHPGQRLQRRWCAETRQGSASGSAAALGNFPSPPVSQRTALWCWVCSPRGPLVPAAGICWG